jgi:hypothetical protein
MKTRSRFWPAMLVAPLLLVAGGGLAAEESVCAAPHPEATCTAANTCGSATAPCDVDIKRTGNGASATPVLPDAKSNKPFCAKVGTTLRWQSTSKNTGFVIDFGSASPFEPEAAIIGGSDRTVSVVAKKAGCYKYSVGACLSGSISGMCGSDNAEVILTK